MHYRFVLLATVVACLLSLPAFAQPPMRPLPPTQFMSTSVETHRWQDEQFYYLDIRVHGISPEDVFVQPRPGGLMVRVERSESVRNENPNGMFFEQRAFNNFQEWIETPPNADLRHMQRENLQGLVRIGLPRIKTAQPQSRPAPPQGRPLPIR